MRWQRLVAPHLIPLTLYSLLTFGYTYPVILNLSSSIPGGGDAFWFLWQLWWFKHAVWDLQKSPLVTDLIYYPLTNVPVTWQTPVNEFFSIPLQHLVGVVPLYNLLFLASFIFSGYFMYLLLTRFVRRRELSFLGGLIFAFCSYRGIRGLGHLSLLTTQWMPFCLFCAVEWCRKPTLIRSILLGGAVGLVALSSPYYVVCFLIPAFAVMGVYLLLKYHHVIRIDRRYFRASFIVLGVAIILVLPFYWSFIEPYQELSSVNATFAEDPYIYAADVLSWILPSGEHPFWAKWTRPIYRGFTTINLMEVTLFFGFVPLLFFLVSLLIPPRWRRLVKIDVIPWQALAIITLLLSFGPVLHLGGKEILSWMPYRLFMALPGSEIFRIPSRVGITAILAVIVVDMVVLDTLLPKTPTWIVRLGVVLWGIGLLFNMPFDFPYPIADTRIPDSYQQIAETTGQFAILELPAGEWYFKPMSRYMYYQTYHHKRLVSGYLGRRPPRLHEQEHLLPFVNYLFNPDFFTGKSSIATIPLGAIANAQLDLYNLGIRFVLLHCESADPNRYCNFALPLLESALGFPSSTEHLLDETIYLYVLDNSAFASGFSSLPLSVFTGETLTIDLLDRSFQQDASGSYSLTTMWFCTGDIDRDYTLYVHIVDSQSNLVVQRDHTLGINSSNAYFTTSHWLCPGYYFDSVEIPYAALPDDFSIAFGIWDPDSGDYLRPDGQLPIDDLGRVRIDVSGDMIFQDE